MSDQQENRIKRNVRDSVFTHLFADKKYVLELYKALHPYDDTVTEDMIDIVTLENVLTYGIYNDLGFTVGDRFLVLVEEQTLWSENILLRLFLYLAKTYKEFLSQRSLNVHMKKRIKLPNPEFYVIYTGSDKVMDGDIITFGSEHFDKTSDFFEMKLRVIKDSKQGDIINQYVTFTKVYTEQLKLYNNDREKAIRETIRICKDKNVLKEYLSKHEKEVEDIMITLYSQDEITEAIMNEARQEGREEGIIDNLRSLMESLSVSLDKAMDLLKIPSEKRPLIAEAFSV